MNILQFTDDANSYEELITTLQEELRDLPEMTYRAKINALVERGNDGKYICSICTDVHSLLKLTRHHIEAKHLRLQRYICKDCNERFDTYQERYSHQTSKRNLCRREDYSILGVE